MFYFAKWIDRSITPSNTMSQLSFLIGLFLTTPFNFNNAFSKWSLGMQNSSSMFLITAQWQSSSGTLRETKDDWRSHISRRSKTLKFGGNLSGISKSCVTIPLFRDESQFEKLHRNSSMLKHRSSMGYSHLIDASKKITPSPPVPHFSTGGLNWFVSRYPNF